MTTGRPSGGASAGPAALGDPDTPAASGSAPGTAMVPEVGGPRLSSTRRGGTGRLPVSAMIRTHPDGQESGVAGRYRYPIPRTACNGAPESGSQPSLRRSRRMAYLTRSGPTPVGSSHTRLSN